MVASRSVTHADSLRAGSGERPTEQRLERLLGLTEEDRSERNHLNRVGGAGGGACHVIGPWLGDESLVMPTVSGTVGDVNGLATVASVSTLERVAGRPTWLLGRANARAQALLAEAFDSAGMRGYCFRVLATLEEHGPASQADLSRTTGIDTSDVVAAVNHLVSTRSRTPRARRQ